MASLAIVTEYQSALIKVGGDVIQVAIEPPLAEQTVDFTAGATATANPLNPATQLVRMQTNVGASRRVSAAGTAATTSNTPISANQPEYFGVAAGQGYLISFITAAAGF